MSDETTSAGSGLIGRLVVPTLGAGALILAAQSWMWAMGPHGWMKPRPECQAEQTCVLVAGLDHDVYFGFGAGDQVFGFDVNDDATERLLSQLRGQGSDGQTVATFKYPREISVPEAGAADEDAQFIRAVDEARVLGQGANADLVVIGRVVNDDYISIAFVDPNQNSAPRPFEHNLDQAEARALLRQRFAAALSAAQRGVTPPPVVEPDLPQQPEETLPPSVSNKPEDETSFSYGPAPTEDVGAPLAGSSPPQIVPARLIDDPAAARRLMAAYPRDALDDNAVGEVDVQCHVARDGRVHTCEVTRNTNERYAFARVARQHALQRRATPQTVDGQPTDDGVITIPFTFNIEN